MLVTSTRETHLSGSTEQGEGHLVSRSPLFRGWGAGICVSHENYKNLLCRDPYEGFSPLPIWLAILCKKWTICTYQLSHPSIAIYVMRKRNKYNRDVSSGKINTPFHPQWYYLYNTLSIRVKTCAKYESDSKSKYHECIPLISCVKKKRYFPLIFGIWMTMLCKVRISYSTAPSIVSLRNVLKMKVSK